MVKYLLVSSGPPPTPVVLQMIPTTFVWDEVSSRIWVASINGVVLSLRQVREVHIQSRSGLSKYLEVVCRSLPSEPYPLNRLSNEQTAMTFCVHSFFRSNLYGNGFFSRNDRWNVHPINCSGAVLKPRIVLHIFQYF